jgi:hypothetical protein
MSADNSGSGDTAIVIVGLPDAAVKESRDRVSTALTNSGFKISHGPLHHPSRAGAREDGAARIEDMTTKRRQAAALHSGFQPALLLRHDSSAPSLPPQLVRQR